MKQDSENLPARPGRVYLIGAGPGDPGLITLRGAACLGRADVVLYDYLANPALLAHAPTAVTICLGKHGASRIWTQAEINARMIAEARSGRTVARLKGGDPAVFGRLVEEAESLWREGIPFEIVPGITAAQAAADCAGIPITHRDLASAVALVTAQENPEKQDSSLDFVALANFPGTLVFYMGVTSASRWSEALLAAGKPAATRVALARRCSLPDQATVYCTLSEVAEKARGLRPPVVAIVGDVAKNWPALGWFERRPLFGQRVLVTRPTGQAEATASLLTEQGAAVRFQPTIEIGPPADDSEAEWALANLAEFAGVVFSSANGVRYFCERILARGGDMRALGGKLLAAIGPGTAAELRRFYLSADLVPPGEFRAESLAAVLAPRVAGMKLLLVRASRGREVLREQLVQAGAYVHQARFYDSRDVISPDPEIAGQLLAGEIDWVTVSSSAIARSLVSMFGEGLRRARLVSISPLTSGVLRELGFAPAVEATAYTLEGMVAAMMTKIEAEKSGDPTGAENS